MKGAVFAILVSCSPNIAPVDLLAHVDTATVLVNDAFGSNVLAPGDEVLVALAPPPTGFDGWTDCSEHCQITLSPSITEHHVMPILLHEIGHALGLAHSADEHDVMFHRVPLNTDPAELARDLAQDCKSQVCIRHRTIGVAQ